MLVNRGKSMEEILASYISYKPKEPARGAENNGSDRRPSSEGVQSTTGFWRIQGVHYRDSTIDVDLAKHLLDGGNAKTQDEWIAYSKEAQAKNEFYTGDMPLQHAAFTATYKLEEGAMKEEIRAFVKKHMFERFLLTTTRIQYQPQGSMEDFITHNRAMSDEYVVKENFVFPDEWIEESTRPSNYKALLGVEDLKEINSVYHWLTGKRAYLWRVNGRSEGIVERVVWLCADSVGLGLGCGWSPSGTGASLGVRAVRRA